jgi:hypothetical protein
MNVLQRVDRLGRDVSGLAEDARPAVGASQYRLGCGNA